MPHPSRNGHGRLGRVVLFSLVAWALVALGRAPRPANGRGAPAGAPIAPAAPPQAATVTRRRARTPRRLATSFSVAVLFFAGASLSAVAGNQAVGLLGDDGEPAAVAPAAAPAEAAPAEAAAPAPAPVEAPAAPAQVEPASAAEPVPAEPAPAPAPAEPVLEPAPAPPAAAEEEVAPASQGRISAPAAPAADSATPAAPEAPAPAPAEPAPAAHAPVERESNGVHAHAVVAAPAPASARPVRTVRAQRAPVLRAAAPAPVAAAPAPRQTPLDPEASAPNLDATVWVHRTLPDPTPSSLRLSPEYAGRLLRSARAAGADWALVLGVLRAQTARPQVPARPATLAETADRLVELGARRNAWNAALAITGRTATSDRALALARYYRAIGIGGLVRGLRAEEDRLAERLLADARVTVYEGGRADLAAGRIDVRVVALIAYLAEAYGQVTVSSLVSGHRIYSRPGVVSAHVYGAAVDIAALAGQPILGHQQVGSVTERAVRDILLLPAELRPRQVISLIGMGGPSFALANHADHIHVGF